MKETASAGKQMRTCTVLVLSSSSSRREPRCKLSLSLPHFDPMFAYQDLLDSINHAVASQVAQSLIHITALQSDPGDIQIYIQSDPYMDLPMEAGCSPCSVSAHQQNFLCTCLIVLILTCMRTAFQRRKKQIFNTNKLELQIIEIWTSCMQSTRSTN